MVAKKNFKKTESLLLIIFCIALIARIPFALDDSDSYFQVQGKPYSDARQNDVFASNWLSGKGYGDYIFGFQYHAYRVPFYSFFLAFIYSIFGHNYFVVKIIQSLLGGATCIIIFYINRAIFNKWIGLLTAFLCALHFNLIIYTTILLAETLFVFLFALAILLVINTAQESSYRKALVSGILIAISALTRSVGIVLLPAALLWICSGAKLQRKKAAQLALLILLGTFITIFPWFLRNYQVTSHPFLFNSIGALQLWNASNPDYYSIDARSAWYEFHWSHPYNTEGERYRIAGKEIKRFIKSDVKGYMAACYRRAFMFYSFPQFNFPKGRFIKPNKFMLTEISIAIILLLAPIGFILLLPQLRRISFLVIISLGYSFFYFLSGENPRYRMPLEIIFISFAAAFIYLLFNIRKIKSWNRIFDKKAAPIETTKKSKGLTSLIAKILCFILAGLTVIFIARVSYTYLSPRKSGLNLKISQSRNNRIMQRKNLLNQWESQGFKSINYNDLFQERAKRYGYFPAYHSQIVVWWGEISYSLRDKNGNISSFYLRINPQPYHFGENTIYCYANERKTKNLNAQHIVDGDIIAIYGHLEHIQEGKFSFPCIIFFHLEKLR